MVDHYEAQLALRATLQTLSVATTGSGTFAATSTGYTRSSGSFVTDGFRIGMEVNATGFTNSANNAAKTLTSVSALALTCSGNAAESATATITAGLPSGRMWENDDYEPVQNTPWVEEQYIPGPMQRRTVGAYAQLEVLPQYAIHVYVPSGKGIGAARSYADALLSLFPPNTAWSLTSGTLRVRGDIAPYEGQLIQVSPGFAVVPVNVPLRLWTTNSV